MTLDELEQALKTPDEFIIRYKDPEFLATNPSVSAHMYIIIPYSDNEVLLLTMITSSEFSKRTANPAMLECIIDIKADEFDFIYKDSIIDCNQYFLKTKAELVENNAKLEKCNKLPSYFLEMIKKRIKQSPMVKKKIKKYIL